MSSSPFWLKPGLVMICGLLRGKNTAFYQYFFHKEPNIVEWLHTWGGQSPINDYFNNGVET